MPGARALGADAPEFVKYFLMKFQVDTGKFVDKMGAVDKKPSNRWMVKEDVLCERN